MFENVYHAYMVHTVMSVSDWFGIEGDVLSGTSSGGIHHSGVLEGWFGEHWWNGRTFVLLITTIAIFAPLASFKRIGK